MNYLKTYELFGVWTEDLTELEDILRDLEDDGVRVDVNKFDGINVYITNSEERPMRNSSFTTPVPYEYSKIKHNIEHLVSYLDEKGYKIDSVYNIVDLQPHKFHYDELTNDTKFGRLEFRFKLKKANEGFFDFFKKKLSDDDQIIQIYIDRLKKIDGVSPYEIEYTEKNVVQESDDAVAMRYHINFHDTPITIIKAEIISPSFNRYTTELKKSLIDNGAIFKNSRTFYNLNLPHQNEDVKGTWQKLEELWELTDKVYKNDKHSSRIRKIRDEINPAEGMIEESNEDYSELESTLTSLIEKGLLPDKQYLMDCFSDLMDDYNAKPFYEIDRLDGFVNKYLINSSEPIPSGFMWTLDVPFPKVKYAKGYKGNIYSDRYKIDHIDEIEGNYQQRATIISEINNAIRRVRARYSNYKFEVYKSDTGIIVEVSTLKDGETAIETYSGVSDALGITKDDFDNGRNYYNPITWLFRKYDYPMRPDRRR